MSPEQVQEIIDKIIEASKFVYSIYLRQVYIDASVILSIFIVIFIVLFLWHRIMNKIVKEDKFDTVIAALEDDTDDFGMYFFFAIFPWVIYFILFVGVLNKLVTAFFNPNMVVIRMLLDTIK